MLQTGKFLDSLLQDFDSVINDGENTTKSQKSQISQLSQNFDTFEKFNMNTSSFKPRESSLGSKEGKRRGVSLDTIRDGQKSINLKVKEKPKRKSSW